MSNGTNDCKYCEIMAVVAALATPLAVCVMTLVYQGCSRAHDLKQTRLDQTFKEVKAITEMLGDWQARYGALQRDCEPDHTADNDKCLNDYTKRLIEMDSYVAKLKLAVSASPVGDYPHERISAFEDEWWFGTRHALDSTFGHMAVREDTSGPLTNADTCDDDYNRLVDRCEHNWADPQCPSLRQCQQHGFEHSECVKEIGNKLRRIEDRSLSAFCAVSFSLNLNRIDALKELDASEDVRADLVRQLCAPGRCRDVLRDYPEAVAKCATVDAGAETLAPRAPASVGAATVAASCSPLPTAVPLPASEANGNSQPPPQPAKPDAKNSKASLAKPSH
jgi:hypothetical protein